MDSIIWDSIIWQMYDIKWAVYDSKGYSYVPLFNVSLVLERLPSKSKSKSRTQLKQWK